MRQLQDQAVDDPNDVARVEDVFRRAVFNWAFSTKRMVDSSVSLGQNTKVAHAALADIEYARGLLDELFIPLATKTNSVPADGRAVSAPTVESVRKSVSSLATRIVTMPREQPRKTPFNAKVEPSKPVALVAPVVCAVDECVTPDSSPISVPRKQSKAHPVADLSAPVVSKNGKMLWATIDCPECPSKATQRCQKPAGGFLEKPHKKRKTMGDATVSVSATPGGEEHNPA